MIVVDVEATGTNPEKHSILSIGALDFDNPTNQFYDECRAWDGAHLEEEALGVNGFTKEEISDPNKKSEAELIKAFVAWATDCHGWNFVGQNPSFDLNFVAAACHRAHIDFPFPHRAIDTHTLAYMHIVKNGNTPPFNAEHHRSNMNLDYILSYVGIPEEPKPHNALTGALCHAEVAARLLYDRQLLPEFEVYPIPWTVIKRG
jgi:DNA polymerase III epsilon subunit-like protein